MLRETKESREMSEPLGHRVFEDHPGSPAAVGIKETREIPEPLAFRALRDKKGKRELKEFQEYPVSHRNLTIPKWGPHGLRCFL